MHLAAILRNADNTTTNHSAYHGNAFNPDTGKIAEYPELRKSSEVPLWEAANAEEIGRLAQGYGDVAGTNTIFFISKDKIPKNKRPTYLRVVMAYRPEKPIHGVFAGLLGATVLRMLATSQPKQLTSAPPKFSSTASFPPPTPNSWLATSKISTWVHPWRSTNTFASQFT